MLEDLDIKCDCVTVSESGFGHRGPVLTINAENVDVDHLIDQLDPESVLDIMDEDDIVSYLQKQGYEVEVE